MTVEAGSRVLHAQTETITGSDLRCCAQTSGEDAEQPLGIACVLALRTIIGSGGLPPGAMMLGYAATWYEPLAPGEFRTEMSIRIADPPRRRYQRVVVGYRTFRAADGHLVLEQEQEVLWPITA